MKKRGRLWSAGAIVALPLLICGLTGCGLPGSTTDVAASPKPTAAPNHSAAGAWVFKNAYTNEVLHLHQNKSGAVGGSGTAAVQTGKGKTDHSAIDVHSGRMTRGKLTLSLYVEQLDWGSGITIVENLRCGVTATVLHCRMDAPVYTNVRNVPQDFVRHA